ncbi:translation initiation factor [Coraliomargarita akajimensis]|uniref:Translation initiation factor SUI1 n=1 Tax=Coraliomargarita akajimensis (strain DSM 45221 / IAM 15411 / JCM 23193 / KCTC 12865 / 04OKA010-24) TaxID=583355 RepID=D5EHR9_CORAD|nr:translation initiation factor [Coraliomargarita akajimensis]ADE54110.1 translation initiation factor SUI1 [Coraliomargarita akajimensis DSM 45221]
MSKRSKGKISTDGGDAFGNTALGGLSLSGLPAGAVSNSKPERESRAPKSRGRVEVRREKAGRGGKTVTTLKAFTTGNTNADLERLYKELKKACACGGVYKDRVIELQGDLVDKLLAELKQRGFQPVKAGG